MIQVCRFYLIGNTQPSRYLRGSLRDPAHSAREGTKSLWAPPNILHPRGSKKFWGGNAWDGNMLIHTPCNLILCSITKIQISLLTRAIIAQGSLAPAAAPCDTIACVMGLNKKGNICMLSAKKARRFRSRGIPRGRFFQFALVLPLRSRH